MRSVVILYATREGQTRKIAERIAWRLRNEGVEVELQDADSVAPDFSVEQFDAAILASSVHIGKHERSMIRFVKTNREVLERIPSAFISVSLTEAGAEDETRTDAEREEARHEVEKMVDAFRKETGWNPTHVEPVAGALRYREYGWFVRFMMKRIAKKAGGPTDVSRDHELTDWDAVDRFVVDFLPHAVAA